MAVQDEAFGWDDQAEVTEEQELTVLTPGEYSYRVDGFERGHYDGGDKMGPCSVAKLELECANGAGEQATVRVNLYLNRKQMWKITQFFKSCFLIEPSLPAGTAYTMPWNRVVGATGRCRIKNREYKGRTYNEVDAFIVPEGF